MSQIWNESNQNLENRSWMEWNQEIQHYFLALTQSDQYCESDKIQIKSNQKIELNLKIKPKHTLSLSLSSLSLSLSLYIYIYIYIYI